MVLWGIAGLALVVALAAMSMARRVSRKLDALTHSYWELRYDFTRLRSQVARLDPESPAASEGDVGADRPQPGPTVAFVPLSAIKRKDKAANGQ